MNKLNHDDHYIVETIQKAVADHFGVSQQSICKSYASRYMQKFTIPRSISVVLCKKLTNELKMFQVMEMHGLKQSMFKAEKERADKQLQQDASVLELVEALIKQLKIKEPAHA